MDKKVGNFGVPEREQEGEGDERKTANKQASMRATERSKNLKCEKSETKSCSVCLCVCVCFIFRLHCFVESCDGKCSNVCFEISTTLAFFFFAHLNYSRFCGSLFTWSYIHTRTHSCVLMFRFRSMVCHLNSSKILFAIFSCVLSLFHRREEKICIFLFNILAYRYRKRISRVKFSHIQCELELSHLISLCI